MNGIKNIRRKIMENKIKMDEKLNKELNFDDETTNR